MRETFALIATALIMGVAACTTTSGGAVAPANAVFAAKTSYEAALVVAVKYNQLPRCMTGGPTICSDANVVTMLRKADASAGAALDSAETVVRTPGATSSVQSAAVASAQQAVGVMQQIITTFNIK